jgi:tetratricopeptide (TPR) repeat protein
VTPRRLALGLIIAGLVPALILARALVHRSQVSRQQLAEQWSAQGRRDLDRRPAAAVTDFETALSYASGRADDRLRLADALIGAGRPAEARAQLLTLWPDEPGSGPINLQLARLAAAGRDVTDAVRYYHAALDGSWERGGAAARRGARLELAKMLLANGQKLRAQAELIALIDDLPDDAGVMTDVGSLLVDAGADNRALPLFRQALRLDPANARAARLAGDVEFRAADYRAARDDFEAAAKIAPLDPAGRDRLDVSARVFALDAFAPAIGARARSRRALATLAVARQRLQRCGAGTSFAVGVGGPIDDLAVRADAAARLRPQALERDVDLVDQVMALAFEIEALAPPPGCAADTPDDRAVRLLSSRARTQAR